MPGLIPWGIWAAAGAGSGGGAASDYELISTTIASGTSLTSLTFSSINTTTYRHLELRLTARTNDSADQGSIKMTFNGDTASNYNTHVVYGASSSVNSASELSLSNLYAGLVAGNTTTTGTFGTTITQILDAGSTNKFKTQRTIGGLVFSTASQIYLRSGLWRSTAAITSITLAPLTGTYFIAGSRFSLYGLK